MLIKKKHFSIHRYLRRKQNSGHGNTITPWRVSSNQDINYKTNVPINATMIGTVASIVPTIFHLYRFIGPDFYSQSFMLVFLLLARAVQMPLVLAFTIKHHKKTSKINPVVPRALQFHEDVDEDDGHNCDNISNEANDEITENTEHPKVTRVEVYNHVDSTDNDNENSDYPDENGDAGDNCECLELAVKIEQIKLRDFEGASDQLPGEVCHM